MTRIGIVVFDGVEELDAVGPWEVFAQWRESFPADGVELATAAIASEGNQSREVRCAKGLRLIADMTIEELLAQAEPLDLLVIPGGAGTRPLMRRPEVLADVRSLNARAGVVASVCTGSLVLAAADLLSGQQATTHWQNLDELAAVDDSMEVVQDVRWIDNGPVLTSAGVAAGMDLSLYLVARFAGSERAAAVARDIDYPMPVW